MSSHWSTDAQNGSMNSGFGGSGRQQGSEGLEGLGAFEGDRVASLEFDNVVFAAATTSTTTAQRVEQRRAGMQAQVEALAEAFASIPAEQDKLHDAERQKELDDLVFASGTQFAEHKP